VVAGVEGDVPRNGNAGNGKHPENARPRKRNEESS
jgi:hypothetical protein